MMRAVVERGELAALGHVRGVGVRWCDGAAVVGWCDWSHRRMVRWKPPLSDVIGGTIIRWCDGAAIVGWCYWSRRRMM